MGRISISASSPSRAHGAGRGCRGLLVGAAETEALRLGLSGLVLQSRVELVENHALFHAMGFRQIAETRHPGFDRTTSLTFRKSLS